MKIKQLKSFPFLIFCIFIISSCQTDDNWTSDDYFNQHKECVNSFSEELEQYENLVHSCCSCSVEKVQSAMTKNEYKELSNKPKKIQLTKIEEITGECLNNFQTDLISIKLRNGNLKIPIDSAYIDSLNITKK